MSCRRRRARARPSRAAAPDWQGRRLTTFSGDDGVELSAPAWTADGAQLVFSRGGSPNRAGEFANPTQHPEGGQSGIFRISLAGGEAVRLGGGSGVAVSPVAARIAFTRGGQLWLQPLDGGEAVEAARVRGGMGSLLWSPDGAHIAFTSSRGTHAFVGVYDTLAKTVRFLDPSVDSDHSPVWSPDGRQLAWIREAASLELTLFKPVREAQPWSIRVADIENGRAREVWRARPGVGSAFRGVVASNQLFWTTDDRLVFPWEENGWTLLHAVPAAGGDATVLTPGRFEVEYVTVSADRRTIYYNSNQNDLDRRDLWRVRPNGAPERLTRTDAIEWEAAPLADGALAFLRSDARRPAHAVIRTGNAEQLLDPLALDGFPVDELVEPEAVIFSAADGMQIHGQLFRPADMRAGERRPALLFLHGGSRRQMLLGWHYGSYYHNAYALNQYLAARGYIVLSVNFRSGIGYGMHFREAENYGAAGGSEFNDVMGAGLYLRGRADVDGERIGLWGGSYGGYLTAMGLSRASDLFRAGVDIHGVHDWNVGIATFVPAYDPKDDPDAARTAFLASPMSTLDGWRSPVLLIHGDDDRNVRFLETVALVEQLRRRDVHVEQLVFPDEVHGFLLHRNWVAAYRATADFFDRMLAGTR
jgi:dipeptidyl aminopeptidase/acylaminoacyl peptidase